MARDKGRCRSGTKIAAALLAPALFAVGCNGKTQVAVKFEEPPPEIRGEVEPAPATTPETRGEVEPPAAVAPEIREQAEPVPAVALAVPDALGSAPSEYPEPAPVSPEAETLPYTHTVRWNGETLSLIALWYTGAGSNWTALAKANPSMDPDRIKLGDKILIPAELPGRRQPLPYERVHPAAPEGSGESASPKQPSGPVTQAEPKGIREVEPPSGARDGNEVFRTVKPQQPPTTSDGVELYGPRE